MGSQDTVVAVEARREEGEPLDAPTTKQKEEFIQEEEKDIKTSEKKRKPKKKPDLALKRVKAFEKRLKRQAKILKARKREEARARQQRKLVERIRGGKPLEQFFGRPEPIRKSKFQIGLDGRPVTKKTFKFKDNRINKDIISADIAGLKGLDLGESLFGNEQIFVDEAITEQLFPKRLRDV